MAADGPITIYAPAGYAGILDADSGYKATITLPHWPSTVIPAAGTDGHADIFDPTTGIIHSFWKLAQEDGKWVSTNYGWSKIDGSGWGDPGHVGAGVRAVGVVPTAGIIRANEIDDGQPEFSHALAISLAASALAKTYVYPATLTDASTSANTGQIPYGALLMLPSNFDDSAITIPMLRKVVATLKKRGAYVVDRNTHTGFVIYVENRIGQPYVLSDDSWGVRSAQLNLIRAGLRQAVSASSWLDGNELVVQRTNPNLLNWRGPYGVQLGPTAGAYDTWQQAIVFPDATAATRLTLTQNTLFTSVSWAKPVANSNVKFTAVTTNGGWARLQVFLATGELYYDSNYVANGASVTFSWPSNPGKVYGLVQNAVGSSTAISGTLVVQ